MSYTYLVLYLYIIDDIKSISLFRHPFGMARFLLENGKGELVIREKVVLEFSIRMRHS